MLYGQPLSQFNHWNRYLGCFLDAAGDFVYSSIVSSEDACKSDCQSSYQFYSFYIDQDGWKHCFCGNSLYTYGTSDVTACRPNADSAYLPVYRAYDSYCNNRSEDHASFLISYPSSYGDFPTLTVKFYYMCDEGFVLSDNTKIKRVTCRETNGTYFWEDKDGPCQVLNCSSLSGPNTWYDVSTDNVTFGTIVTVTCNNSLFMADGNRSKTLTCLDSVQWNDTVTSCTYPFCPVLPPSIRNGKYEMDADGTHAKYSCHDFYQLTTNTNEEQLSCLPNQQWQTVNFSCEINDTSVLYRQGEFDLLGHFMRQQNGDEVILSYITTSIFTCTDRCLKNTRCVAYSYNQQGRDCVLFNNRAQSQQLVQNSDWKYFEMNLLLMQ
uniref:Uncharacterized protein LOC111105466 n=1 Tax=Crassostrea virginica TaxID=6565 RepID=A0A8B8AWK2_CRAVI|nr:uncharacterized protein LOC111105466 [Crassostrea virginica]